MNTSNAEMQIAAKHIHGWLTIAKIPNLVSQDAHFLVRELFTSCINVLMN